MDHTVFILLTHHTCLNLVSVRQTAPPLTGSSSQLIADFTTYINADVIRLHNIVYLSQNERRANKLKTDQ